MKELRVAKITAETRAEGAAEPKALVLVGMPIVFDTPTVINDPRIGSYTEIIERRALEGVDLTDTRLLYNHDVAKIPLARAPKTMSLNVTERGVEMRAELADTENARAVYTAVERGDLDGMSFGFKVPEGGDTFDRETRTRTIHKIEKIYEVSVVAFPAYPTTSVEAREALEHLEDPGRVGVLITLNKILFKGNKVKKKRDLLRILLNQILFNPKESKPKAAPAPKVINNIPNKPSAPVNPNLVICEVSVDGSTKLYTYLSRDTTLKRGDTVKVPVKKGYKIGKIKSVRPFSTVGLKMSVGRLKYI